MLEYGSNGILERRGEKIIWVPHLLKLTIPLFHYSITPES
jgi:hypothetical protein